MLATFASLFLDDDDDDDDDDDSGQKAGGAAALRSSLTALRWISRKAQVPEMKDALDAPYASDSRLRPTRREAPPLPLAPAA